MEDQNKKLKDENVDLLAAKNSLEMKLILVFDEKQKSKEELTKAIADKSKVETQCRLLQAERSSTKPPPGNSSITSSSGSKT